MISLRISRLSSGSRNCAVAIIAFAGSLPATCAHGAMLRTETICTLMLQARHPQPNTFADQNDFAAAIDALSTAFAPLKDTKLCRNGCEVSSVRMANDVLWVGTDHGIAAFENASWRAWTAKDGLPLERVTGIDVDKSTGDLWLGTLGGGLARFTGGRIDVFDQFNSGLPGNLVFGVAAHLGRVYAATNGGLCAFDPRKDEWDLLVPRRADESPIVVIDLVSVGDALYAKLWPYGTARVDITTGELAPTRPDIFVERKTRLQRFTILSVEASSPAKSATDVAGGPMIAVLGPGTRRMPLAGEPPILGSNSYPDLVSARIALNTAAHSAASGRVELWSQAPGYASYGWGLLEDDLIAFAGHKEIVGLVVNVDSHQGYTAASLAAVGIPTVNIAMHPPAESDRDADTRWNFHCFGDEPRQVRTLLDLVANRERRRRWVIVDCGDDARVMWTISYAAHLGLPRPKIVHWDYLQESAYTVIKAVEVEQADAVICWCGSEFTAELLAALCEVTPELLFVSGSQLVNDAFITLTAGRNPLVLAIAPSQNAQTCATELQAASSSGKGLLTRKAPSQIECRTFDAADHLAAAISAGLASRQGVRQSLSSMERDIFGESHFERHHPTRPVRIARVADRHWVYEEIAPESTVTEDSSP